MLDQVISRQQRQTEHPDVLYGGFQVASESSNVLHIAEQSSDTEERSTECGDEMLPPQNANCERFRRLALTDSNTEHSISTCSSLPHSSFEQ
jgi:hypothetical protein